VDYYYAGGKKIALKRDDELVAFDEAAAASAGVDARRLDAASGVRRGPGGVLVAPRRSLGERQMASLRKANALLPVFRRDQAILVALPEVRVEFDDAKERKAVKALLASKADAVKVTQDADDLLVLRLSSGDGDDALTLANQIYERARPAASSVRFIQFVPRPGTLR
jgi:hypothetical protein